MDDEEQMLWNLPDIQLGLCDDVYAVYIDSQSIRICAGLSGSCFISPVGNRFFQASGMVFGTNE